MTDIATATIPYDSEYSELLSLLVELIESQNGNEIEPENEWLNDAQILSIKLFRHLTSMKLLASGSMVKVHGMQDIFHIDHPSINVIARAALETYLVFHFIFDSKDQSLSRFRHKLWRIGGLADRQKYNANFEHAHETLAKEKHTLRKLRTEVQNSCHFHTFTKPQQRQLLKGIWRNGFTWADLGCSADFHVPYFEDVYNYLCGYSHSSYLSALQIGQAQLVGNQQEFFARVILRFGIVLMSHFTFSYPNVFPEAKHVLSANPKTREFAKQFKLSSEHKLKFYDR